MKRVFALLLMLWFAGTLCAEIKLEGKTEIPRDSLFDLKLTGLPDKSIVFWDFLNNEADLTRVNMKTRFICNGPPNTYRLRVRVISFDKDGNPDSTELSADLVIKGKVDPPGPGPKPPEPPDPPVPPSPSPIPVAGFRVLIIYDALAKSKMPKEQQSILTSKSVRDYLRLKCATDTFAEQDSKAYRIWPADTVVPDMYTPGWKDAMKRPRASLPWILVSNHPGAGFEGPLPENSDATISLLKKYAEPAPKSESGKVSPEALEEFRRHPYGRRDWLRLGTSLLVKGGRGNG